MKWVQVEIFHVRRGEWIGYARDFDLFSYGSSREEVKREMYRLLEESQGEHTFSVIYSER